MTADVVNLRRARKAKAREEHQRTASANRATFGQSKAEKTERTKERERASRALEGHRRDPSEPEG